MKHILIVMVVVLLMALTATTALASHGAKLPAAPMPAHGSVWFGEGVGQVQAQTTRLSPPLHGSIWHVGSPARDASLDVTSALPAHGSVWFGGGQTIMAGHTN